MSEFLLIFLQLVFLFVRRYKENRLRVLLPKKWSTELQSARRVAATVNALKQKSMRRETLASKGGC